MLVHLRVLGMDIVELTVVTDDAEVDDDSVSGMGSVESLHVAEAEPADYGEAGFTKPHQRQKESS